MTVVLLGVALAVAGGVRASETVDTARPIGHPRERFPLAVHLLPPRDATLEAPIQRAIDDWNAVAREALGVEAFRWHEREEGAAIVIRFVPSASEPTAMGATSRETVLFQLAAHEVGHALGLPHTDDPGSIMCCLKGAVNFADPAIRARYVDARRHPDVRSALGQLLDLYPRFWQR